MAARSPAGAWVVAGQSSSQRPLALVAAQGDDVGGAFDGPVHAGLFRALDDDRLDAAFDRARAGEHAKLPEVCVAHPVGVVAEVAELSLQVAGIDASRG